jgi:hypothetical protein
MSFAWSGSLLSVEEASNKLRETRKLCFVLQILQEALSVNCQVVIQADCCLYFEALRNFSSKKASGRAEQCL